MGNLFCRTGRQKQISLVVHALFTAKGKRKTFTL